ncbi:MDR family MFS transporter [Aspergillus homomorphus CBS 101889]|uniref:MFS transporter n=1 Tax=Aspergillus homomorphus (strain CBS 101889) TaxID=1450537 RepID=A0A395HQK0_ASPHC|nr:MFS transporter [Aspergillus homomorphus CBS 101889]RAL10221.1 MFS transporter [Aspergillus homomorphus CBS 101889]
MSGVCRLRPSRDVSCGSCRITFQRDTPLHHHWLRATFLSLCSNKHASLKSKAGCRELQLYINTFPVAKSTRDAAPHKKSEAEEIPLDARNDSDGGDVAQQPDEDEDTILTGYRLVAVMIGLCCCVLCISLDNTIVATAIPTISAHFQSRDDAGWYASAYLLTTSAVTLVYGRIYTFVPVKWVYLSALFLFELGSLVSGVAPSSTALIIGRAVAGLGGGGLFVPRRRRPAFSGFIMGMYGIGSVIAPPLGGAFTDHLTWRWCFYINLPLGAVTAIAIVLTLQHTNSIVKTPWREKLRGLDPLGILTFLPAIISLLLGLQWGGTTYAWSNSRIIGLFCVFGVLLLSFTALQLYSGERALLPPRLLRKRNIWGSALFSFSLNSAIFIFIYYLPIWFQTIKGATATSSGVMNLPLTLTNALVALSSGLLVTALRAYPIYSPLMLLSATMASISAGFLTTLHAGSGSAAWVGYQVFFGLAAGLGIQLPVFVVQTTLTANDIPSATALMAFVQLLGGAVFVFVGQNVFGNRLVAALGRAEVDGDLPAGVDPGAVLAAGPAGLRVGFTGDALALLVKVYNYAVVRTFLVGVALAAVSVLGAAVVEWRPVQEREKRQLVDGSRVTVEEP